MGARDRLIVGLDVPTVKEAETIVATLGDDILFYKIGHQLAFAGGLELARDLASSGKKIFLDMKLLDIDNTVASGVENIANNRPDARMARAAPVRNAACGDTRVQIAPKSRLAASVPTPSAAL